MRRPRPKPKLDKLAKAKAKAKTKKQGERNRTSPSGLGAMPEKPPGDAAIDPQSPATASLPTPKTSVAPAAFPIIGVGASAGGLEALEEFLKHVPARSGVALVVIQHLDPNRDGMLVELLQRVTSMKVSQATDATRVEPDHVYVIPPGKDMSILHGVLHLLPLTQPRGLNLPIDFFFRSLAEDQEHRSIAVILSGMGTDGTLGLRAIKEKAGATFVQSIASAKFDGMPRSAIESGLPDIVAPVAELPERILSYLRHASHLARSEVFQDRAQSALDKVFVLLRAQTGNDFSQYKQSTILRRIERRMGLHQIDNITTYVRFLRENPREIDLLFKELLIGVTCFFRDPPAWEHLEQEVLPALLASRETGRVLRAWVPGCSTGEEAYSLAMVFREAVAQRQPEKNIGLQIFATDLDDDAIDRARQGFYPDNIAADVSPERLRQFFVQEDRGYRISKGIREMVVFARQNLIMDPPFTKLDLLSCRNLLIYLSADIQKKLIPMFHYSLNPGGVLFLGSAETIGAFSGLFSPADGKSRLFRRVDHAAVSLPIEVRATEFAANVSNPNEASIDAGVEARASVPNLESLANRVLVQRFAPVGVVCNDKGDVLYVSGRAGKYLEPAVGKANLNVFAMAREGLRYDLSRAFSTALKEPRLITARGLKVGSNGSTQVVDLSVQRIYEPKELRGHMLVVFTDVATQALSPRAARKRSGRAPTRVADLEDELQQAREEAQTVREEMQTSQEELKSTNEELQSTNEELQSSNEELTTSKEEMQSLNEELQTVNHELQAKVDELSRNNNDMKNLLNSTDIATLFLDGELNVRRFTTPTARIIKLIAGDAGRPITDITSELHYPDLAEDAREVLRTLVFKEKHVTTRDGRWFTVRIMPYRTVDNVIDGVVITFSDASAARALEIALREQASQLRQMAESLPNLVWGCRPDGVCDYVSKQWVAYTGIPDAEQLGFGWLDQVHPEDRDRVRDEWRATVKLGGKLDTELRIRAGDGSYRWFKARSIPIHDSRGAVTKWYGTCTDVDDLKRAEHARLSGLAAVLDNMSEALVMVDRALTVVNINPAAARILACEPEQARGKRLGDVLPDLGGAVEGELRRALVERRPSVVEAELGTDGARQRYSLRVFPQSSPEGLSVLFDRSASPAD